MITIAVSGGKGGTAKTATAVNLAAFLGQKHPTLLVDLDPQGHCAECFALDSLALSPTVYDVLFERSTAADAIRALRDKLSLLPANRDLLLGEVELKDEFARERRLADALEGLAFEYVVIDCPPNIGQLVVNALFASDVVIVPVSSPLALQSTYHLFDVMESMGRRFSRRWQLRGLQTFYRAGVRESERLNAKLKEEFRGKVFETRINLNTQISMAMTAGRPILDYPHSSGYTDYRKLTDEVLDVTGTQAGKDRRGGGGQPRLYDATGTLDALD